MKNIYRLLLLSFCCTFLSIPSLHAQSPFSIKGTVVDTNANAKLYLASISILNAKDSTLVKYTWTSESGMFSIAPLKPGNFLMLLAYPDYADYVYPFSLSPEQPAIDLGRINMTLKAALLNEVIIRGKSAAIKIKGDTTEFNASSYTIQPGDKVEDLLAKMPGIQIDKDGKITARGKTVPKVLVDGEEFFGDDPTLVTKNIRADMVDKVQLYEKKSDQATFTGVDDGERTQTINIVLKEDKKNGFFGKVEAGAGTSDFYTGQLMFNKFKAKEKIAVYGILGNTGKIGLNWNEQGKYSGMAGEVEIMDGGGIMITATGDFGGLDSFSGSYDGQGIPNARNAGAHYENKWNNDKQSINVNFKTGKMEVDKTGKVLTQQNLPGGWLFNDQQSQGNNTLSRQGADVTYQIKPDSNSNLKISFNGSLKNADATNTYQTLRQRGDQSLLNTERRSLSNNGDEQAFSSSLFYTRKLKKAGRNFSVRLNQSFNEKISDGYLYAKNMFFDTNGQHSSTEVTDQLKTNNALTHTYSGNVTYNEPFSKTVSLVLNYGLTYNSGDADRKSFNASAPGRYDILDPEYSNHFITDQVSSNGGAVLSYKNKKTTLSGGVKMNATRFDQQDVHQDIRYKRSFLNWMPQLRYQYRISQYRGISLNYRGYTSQPSLSQLQPVKVNEDVLNIPVGNPNLKPSYDNSFSFDYESYKVISSTSFNVYGGISFDHNQIVNNTTTDLQTGKSTYQYINMTDKMPLSYDIYIYQSTMIKAIDMALNLNVNTNGSNSYNYVNSQLNKTTNANYNLSAGLSKYKEKKYNVSFSFGPAYNAQQSSLNKQVNSNGWSYNGNGAVRVFLPAKLEIGGDARYTYSPKTSAFDQHFEQTLINAGLTKKFFKESNLALRLTVNDLLNQNTGFSRNASANTITQSEISTIKRYFLFSLSWDFSKMGGAVKK